MELNIKGNEFALKALKSFIVYRRHEVIPLMLEIYGIKEEDARKALDELHIEIKP